MVQERKKEILAVFLAGVILLIALAAGVPDVIAKAEPDDSIYVDGVVFAHHNYTDVQTIHVPYLNVKTDAFCDTPYSDEFFTYGSETFDPELARASYGLTVSAFRNDAYDLPNQYETYLGEAGFSDIYAFGYDTPPTADSIAGVIAHKKIGDFTLIAAAPCGQGYKKEWAGNLKVGDSERHEGFDEAAKKFEAEIAQYMSDHNIDGKVKIWLSGFSRASAVSNIMAADYVEEGRFEDVYAYLFGVPRTTKNPVPYRGIYNICGSFDPVPNFPMSTWGYERYGCDLILPAQEEDSEYSFQVRLMNDVYSKVMGQDYHNIPLINYRTHLLIEFLAEMFPTNADYAETLQGLLIDAMADPEKRDVVAILTEVFSKLGELDQSQEEASQIFIDYLQMLASEHLRGEAVFNEEMGWDPNVSIAFNYLREHFPAVYQSWVYSELDPELLYQEITFTRRLVFLGDLDISVTDSSGKVLKRIDRNGKVYRDESLAGTDATDIFMYKTGEETIIALPMDREYTVQLETDKLQSIIYYQVINTSAELTGYSDKMYIGMAKPGFYEMKINLDELELPPIEAITGNLYDMDELDLEYKPSLSMASETQNTKHLTIGQILLWIMIIVAGLLVLGLVCLVIAIVHKIKIKKGKRSRPYSNLYVIIPHLLLVALFAFLVYFASRNLVSIGIAKNILCALMMFCVFLLALRGTLRCLTAEKKGGYRKQSKRKKLFAIVFTILMLGMTAVCYFFFNNSVFSGYRPLNNFLFLAAVLLFCVIGILLFPRRLPEKAAGSESGQGTSDDELIDDENTFLEADD